MVLIYIRRLFKKGINDTTYTLETTWRDFSDTDISYIILGIESIFAIDEIPESILKQTISIEDLANYIKMHLSIIPTADIASVRKYYKNEGCLHQLFVCVNIILSLVVYVVISKDIIKLCNLQYGKYCLYFEGLGIVSAIIFYIILNYWHNKVASNPNRF